MTLYLGIFLVAAGTLLLEIVLTRIFSVLYFHHFAFLIISTALFGFGFSGIYLFVRKKKEKNFADRLSLASLLFAVLLLVVYKIILVIPHEFSVYIKQPIQLVRLILDYALLAIPFFFSGYVIGAILTQFPERAGRLYCADLLGAATGCLLALWLVPLLGGSGTIAAAALIVGLAALIFSAERRTRLRWITLIFILAAGVLTWKGESFFRIPIEQVIQEKYPLRRAPGIGPEYSAWSPVSRIDVMPTTNKLILLDGGSNVSFMVPFKGDVSKLPPRWNWRAVPYAIQYRQDACIIGPGGGEDVLMALSHKVKSTTAVEMDPLIVNIVRGKYADYIGHIFDHPTVRTLNDEGRSYLRRTPQQFDLIQQVHNISPMAIATGALNLSESYLLTLEAFREYWRHLKPGGMLAINRWGIVRAASLASLALQQEGITDPENYVLVTSRFKSGADESFYLKKGKITPEDLVRLQEKIRELRIQIDYAPTPAFQNEENIYYRLLVPTLREDFIRKADLNLDAPTDDKPFFDHFQRLGRFQTTTTVLPRQMNKALEYLNLGDLALFTLLGEAALLSFLFIVLPLVRLRRLRKTISHWSILAYFAALGLGFILIEISLIQKHILFLGQPVYSITAVLFFLLLTAGSGSFLFQKLFGDGKEASWLIGLGAALAILILLEITVVPKLFHLFLGAGKVARFFISGLLIAPLGLVLGIPFPLGIRILGNRAPEAIPWGWALNAYATVIGSILCVILAITWGFNLNLLSAVLIYFAGFASLYYGMIRQHSN